MSSVEERIAVVETKTDTGIELLKEIRDDVKQVIKDNIDQELRIASLEQSRATGKRLAKILGLPVIGAIIATALKAVGLY